MLKYLQWYNITFIEPCENFQFNSWWTQSISSSSVGQITCAVIYIKCGYKYPLLGKIRIHNFSWWIVERVYGWSMLNVKEWVSFFLGSWGMNWECGTNKLPENRFAVHTIFLSRAPIHSPWTQKKTDTHSLLQKVNYCYTKIGSFRVLICPTVLNFEALLATPWKYRIPWKIPDFR